jgi:hypothetical protein
MAAKARRQERTSRIRLASATPCGSDAPGVPDVRTIFLLPNRIASNRTAQPTTLALPMPSVVRDAPDSQWNKYPLQKFRTTTSRPQLLPDERSGLHVTA